MVDTWRIQVCGELRSNKFCYNSVVCNNRHSMEWLLKVFLHSYTSENLANFLFFIWERYHSDMKGPEQSARLAVIKMKFKCISFPLFLKYYIYNTLIRTMKTTPNVYSKNVGMQELWTKWSFSGLSRVWQTNWQDIICICGITQLITASHTIQKKERNSF